MKATEELTTDEVYKRGLEALARELGPVGMVRFLQMFEPGKGDYVKQRQSFLRRLTRDEINVEVERQNARIAKGIQRA